MRVEDDGNLTLHVADLYPENREVHPPELRHFSVEARMAAAYANQAGYNVTFCRPGHMIVELKPEARYLKPKRVRALPKPRPVPKYAVGRGVDEFPAKRIYRQVSQYLDMDDAFKVTGHRWILAPRGSAIEEDDVWKDRTPRRKS